MIVTYKRNQIVLQRLLMYSRYNSVKNIIIHDNNNLNEREELTRLSHKIRHLGDGVNTGLYGGIDSILKFIRSSKILTSHYILLDDDAFLDESELLRVNSHLDFLKENVGVSLHVSDEDNETMTETLIFENKVITNIKEFTGKAYDHDFRSYPNIGVVFPQKVIFEMVIPDKNLFFCGESFLFDNIRNTGAKVRYLKGFKIYHKKHSFKILSIIGLKHLKISIVSNFHDYYEIRNFIIYKKQKGNMGSLFISILVISILKIIYSNNKASKSKILLKAIIDGIKF